MKKEEKRLQLRLPRVPGGVFSFSFSFFLEDLGFFFLSLVLSFSLSFFLLLHPRNRTKPNPLPYSPCVDPPPSVPDPSWSRLQSQQKPCESGIRSETSAPPPVVAHPQVGFEDSDPASQVSEGQPVPVLIIASRTP